MLITIRRFVFTLVSATVVGSVPATGPDEQIGHEFRQALLRLVQSGALSPDDGMIVLERPAERVGNFGLLVDHQGDDGGLRVLGTLPGGGAERMGLRADDRVISANGIDLRAPEGGDLMRRLIDSWEDGEEIELQIARDGRAQMVKGPIQVLTLPALRLELQSQRPINDPPSGDPNSTCARVTTFPSAPRSQDLFPAQLLSVDDAAGAGAQQSISSDRSSFRTLGEHTFRIEPGARVLNLIEAVDEHLFSPVAQMQRSRWRRSAVKQIRIDAEPGVTYWVAAKLDRSRVNRVLEGDFWEPVVWKQQAERCR